MLDYVGFRTRTLSEALASTKLDIFQRSQGAKQFISDLTRLLQNDLKETETITSHTQYGPRYLSSNMYRSTSRFLGDITQTTHLVDSEVTDRKAMKRLLPVDRAMSIINEELGKSDSHVGTTKKDVSHGRKLLEKVKDLIKQRIVSILTVLRSAEREKIEITPDFLNSTGHYQGRGLLERVLDKEEGTDRVKQAQITIQTNNAEEEKSLEEIMAEFDALGSSSKKGNTRFC